MERGSMTLKKDEARNSWDGFFTVQRRIDNEDEWLPPEPKEDDPKVRRGHALDEEYETEEEE